METRQIDRSPLPGHIAMLAATVMWGAMAPIAKGVLQEGYIGSVALSGIRITGGAVLFLLAALLPGRITGDVRVERKDFLSLFLASLLMISFNQGLFIIGIGYTSPVDTSVMCTLTPVFTLILAALFIGQKMTLLKVTGVILGLAGALLMSFSEGGAGVASDPLLGDSLCMAAQICAAVYYVFFLKIINRYPPFTIMKWMFLFSLVTYVPCVSPFMAEIDWASVSSGTIWSLVYIILFPTFIAYLIIPFSQRLLKPTVISMYAYFQPVVSAVLATIMGLALFGFDRIMATVLIFVGVALVSVVTGGKFREARRGK